MVELRGAPTSALSFPQELRLQLHLLWAMAWLPCILVRDYAGSTLLQQSPGSADAWQAHVPCMAVE